MVCEISELNKLTGKLEPVKIENKKNDIPYEETDIISMHEQIKILTNTNSKLMHIINTYKVEKNKTNNPTIYEIINYRGCVSILDILLIVLFSVIIAIFCTNKL